MSVDSFKATAEQAVSQTAETDSFQSERKGAAGGSVGGATSPHVLQPPRGEGPALPDRRLLWEG